MDITVMGMKPSKITIHSQRIKQKNGFVQNTCNGIGNGTKMCDRLILIGLCDDSQWKVLFNKHVLNVTTWCRINGYQTKRNAIKNDYVIQCNMQAH